MQLKGRSALVTGATGGIGRAIARELAARGCDLTVTGRRELELQRLVGELGPAARGLTADLTNLGEVRDLMDSAGAVDVLVANAGIGIPQDLAMLSDDEIEEAVRINLLAPAALARAAVAPMKQRGQGHIVFMSSGAGLIATPGNGTIYTATKWGLRGLGLALRQELHGTGVGVSTIFPGPIRDAGMLADTGVTLPRGFGTSSPEDVARAVAEAIERDKPETTVASAGVRLLVGIAAVAPVLIGELARLAGVGRVRDAMLGRV
ncbi:SDR family NAD(P)-dependent oxidoreductase [Mycobacterium hubeiense]|uniref:SDR family NAD(P)-dependent oxidoreductase n=1 Tax=Mycobacterium hubeiense TaxID=1867256 RepID=UPI000C7E9FBB|nr:SDR family NAD(P)-dependent oxidoreductase [Mycobacterium sp. QGD 101]